MCIGRASLLSLFSLLRTEAVSTSKVVGAWISISNKVFPYSAQFVGIVDIEVVLSRSLEDLVVVVSVSLVQIELLSCSLSFVAFVASSSRPRAWISIRLLILDLLESAS